MAIGNKEETVEMILKEYIKKFKKKYSRKDNPIIFTEIEEQEMREVIEYTATWFEKK